MNNYSSLYWLTRLDNFNTLLIITAILSAIVIFIYCLCYAMAYDGKSKQAIGTYKKHKNRAFWIGTIACILVAFIPTKNEIVFIIAGGKTMSYIQSDTSLNKIPYQTTKIISDYLAKQIKEVK